MSELTHDPFDTRNPEPPPATTKRNTGIVLVWSDEPPKVPGTYLARRAGHASRRGWWLEDWPCSPPHTPIEWAGPISEPQEPADAGEGGT
jgi:hypothetical protein